MDQIDGDIHPGGPGGQLQESLWLPDASFRACGLSPSPCEVESLPSPAGEETPPGPARYPGGNAWLAFENGNRGLTPLHCKNTTLENSILKKGATG